MRTETLMSSHHGLAREVFHDEVILFTWDVTQVTSIGDALRIRVLTILTCLTLRWL